MKAIIFAAGLGTRLKPLTNNCPKALIPLCGKPLIWHTINNLNKYGIEEVVVNVHHHSKLLIDYLCQTNWNIPVNISDETDLLYDTGGGLLKARRFLESNDPFMAINVDIISSINLERVIEFHKKSSPLATLVIRNRQTNRWLLFDELWRLAGWRNSDTGEEIISSQKSVLLQPFAFSGIHIISPAIFDLIEEKGKFSIIDLYLRLAKKNAIMGFEDLSDFWLDLGKPGQIAIAEKYLLKK